MKLRDVPPRQGVLWVRNGFRAFFKRPLAFASLFAGLLLMALLAMAVPYLGPVFVLACLPLVSLGFMIATRLTLLERTPLPMVFTAPLRVDAVRRLALLRLGLFYAGATFVLMWICDTADGGRFHALQATAATSDVNSEELVQLLADPRLQAGMWLRMALAALLALPFWHAPALVHWGGLSAGKALFASTLACWRNKGAFAAYGLTWVALMFLFGTLIDTVLLLLGQSGTVAVAAVPAALLFMTVFYASLFFTYADCFEPTEAVAPTTGPKTP